MSEKKTETRAGQRGERRPYEAPDIESSEVFERQSLSCSARLNQTPAFPAQCALQS